MVITCFFDERYGMTEINSHQGTVTISNCATFNRPLLLGTVRDGNEYEWSLEMFGYVEWACCVNYDIHGKTLTIYHTQGVFELTLDDGACGLADAMGALAV